MGSLAAAGSMFDEGSARTGSARSVDLAQLVKACALNEQRSDDVVCAVTTSPGRSSLPRSAYCLGGLSGVAVRLRDPVY